MRDLEICLSAHEKAFGRQARPIASGMRYGRTNNATSQAIWHKAINKDRKALREWVRIVSQCNLDTKNLAPRLTDAQLETQSFLRTNDGSNGTAASKAMISRPALSAAPVYRLVRLVTSDTSRRVYTNG